MISLCGCMQVERRVVAVDSLCELKIIDYTCFNGERDIKLKHLRKDKKWYLIDETDLTNLYISTLENK